MTVAQALALIAQLVSAVRHANAWGQPTIREEDLDRAIAEIDSLDSDLTDAINRARGRDD